MSKSKIRQLCAAAVFAAVYVLLDYVAELMSKAILTGNIKITLSGLPVIIGAIMLGPVWGGLIGAVGEAIVQLLTFGLSAESMLYVAVQAICGVAVGLMYILLKRSDKIIPLAVNIISTRLLLTVLNTAAIYVQFVIIYKSTYAVFTVMLLFRFVSAVLTSAVLLLIVPTAVRALRKVVK